MEFDLGDDRRHLHIRKHIVILHDSEIDHFIGSPGEDRIINEMVVDFEKFEEMKKMSQKKSTTLMPVRDMQDSRMTFYQKLERKLSSNPSFVHGVVFQTALYHVQCSDDAIMARLSAMQGIYCSTIVCLAHRPHDLSPISGFQHSEKAEESEEAPDWEIHRYSTHQAHVECV